MKCPKCNANMTESISLKNHSRTYNCYRCAIEIKDDKVTHDKPNYEKRISKYHEYQLIKTMR